MSSYKERLFTRYGSPSREADIRLTGYLIRPDDMPDFAKVKYYDDYAARLIAGAKRLIADLTEYRQDLYKRYNDLATMPSRDRLSLKRTRTSYGDISYDVTIVTVYDDGTETIKLIEHYAGRERHKAIARFEELKKQYNGIEAVKDIEKPKWERR